VHRKYFDSYRMPRNFGHTARHLSPLGFRMNETSLEHRASYRKAGLLTRGDFVTFGSYLANDYGDVAPDAV
jgi:hypothetical protein